MEATPMDQSGFWLDLVTVYGPLALGWPIAFYLLRYILTEHTKARQTEVETMVTLTAAMRSLEEWVREAATRRRGTD